MYGVPIITADTGSVKDYVVNGVNSFTLNLNDTYIDYAKKILSTVNEESLYNSLKNGCIEMFEKELNWDR